MSDQVEVGWRSVLGPGQIGSGSRSLRLLAPWTSDEAALWEDGHSRADGPAQWAGDRRRLALVSAVELELARPSAIVVMRQILDAWRAAERQLDATFEGSLERRHIQAQIATLRELYQGLFAQVRQGLAERSPI
jgi:hypothetical protein